MPDYTPQKPEAIQRAIGKWINENGEKIPGILSLGYGWETWVQADLGYYLAVELKLYDAILLRETSPYNDRRRVDLAIYGANGQAWHYFELKCQSSKDENLEQFLAGLNADWKKLEDLRKSKPYARFWALGFWVGSSKPSGMTNWNFSTYNGISVLSRAWYPA